MAESAACRPGRCPLRAVVLSCLLCTVPAAFATEVEDLAGTWALSDEAADVVAANCRSLRYTIAPSSITLVSGQMVLTTRPELESGGAMLVLRQVVTAYNGLANCSGHAIPYVVGQRIGNLHLQVRSGRLRLALPGERYVEFVRVPASRTP